LLEKKAGIRKRLLATAAEIVCCPIPAEQIPARFRSGERSALLVSELSGDGSIGIWDRGGYELAAASRYCTSSFGTAALYRARSELDGAEQALPVSA
jgi:hypothetical protein